MVVKKLEKQLRLLEELEQAGRITRVLGQKVILTAHEGIVELSKNSPYYEFLPERMTVDEAHEKIKSYGVDSHIINFVLAEGCEPLEEGPGIVNIDWRE